MPVASRDGWKVYPEFTRLNLGGSYLPWVHNLAVKTNSHFGTWIYICFLCFYEFQGLVSDRIFLKISVLFKLGFVAKCLVSPNQVLVKTSVSRLLLDMLWQREIREVMPII